MELDKFGAARRASGLTIDKAAVACDVSRPTYNAREHDPLNFRLGELVRLNNALDDTGKRLLHEAIESVFEE